jgi:hypothetical protein
MINTNRLIINGYLVGNFSQYLNALDFKKQEIAKGSHYLFVLCTHPKVYKEIKKNLVPADWNGVWIYYSRFLIFLTQLKIPYISSFAYLFNEYWVYKKALKRTKKTNFEFFAVGNYFYPTYRSVSNIANKKKVVVLDDGANIISAIDDLLNNRENNYLAEFARGSFFFKELKTHYESSLLYFGIYRKLKFRETDQVLFNNRFNKDNDTERLDCCYFIGQKIYDGMLSLDRYTILIKETIKELNTKQVYYIPHRMESDADIAKLTNHFEILKPGCPIETYIMNHKKSPTIFISYYSGALLNLKLMNMVGVEFYALKALELIKSKLGKKLENVYNYYSAEGINIIDK